MRKVIVEFGDLNIGDKFTFDGEVYFKAHDHMMASGHYKNALSLKHGVMVYFYNEEDVTFEVPVTFADICGVQPMASPTGQVFTLRVIYGNEEVQCVSS